MNTETPQLIVLILLTLRIILALVLNEIPKRTSASVVIGSIIWLVLLQWGGFFE